MFCFSVNLYWFLPSVFHFNHQAQSPFTRRLNERHKAFLRPLDLHPTGDPNCSCLPKEGNDGVGDSTENHDRLAVPTYKLY